MWRQEQPAYPAADHRFGRGFSRAQAALLLRSGSIQRCHITGGRNTHLLEAAESDTCRFFTARSTGTLVP